MKKINLQVFNDVLSIVQKYDIHMMGESLLPFYVELVNLAENVNYIIDTLNQNKE